MRLQPGYWYVPAWDDPSLAFNSDFKAPESSTNAAFTLQPYTPENVGVIVGF